MKIFLDDIRLVNSIHDYGKGIGYYNDWVVIRDRETFEDFILNRFDDVELISFDHDLSIFDDFGIEWTGKSALDFVIDYCIDNGKFFPYWYVHSSNPSGKKNIISLILNYVSQFDSIDISMFRYYHSGFFKQKFI